MAPFGARDLDIFFRDGSACVAPNGARFHGHLDFPEELSSFGGQAHMPALQGQPKLTYAASALATPLKKDDLITVDGVSFQLANKPRQINDGMVLEADLNKARATNA